MGSYVEHLARIVFPGWATERNMAMYSAYFDESTGSDSPVLVVAGFLSDAAQWSLFEAEWKAAVDASGVTAYHATEYATRKKEFRGMGETERQRLMGALLEILQRRAQFGFGCAVHLKAFEQLFKGKERAAIGSPYALCALGCNLQVGEWAAENHQTEPIAFFYDSGHKNSGEVTERFLAEKNDPENTAFRLGSLTFADDGAMVPLQAADLAAYELWKWLDEHYARKLRHGRFPLQEIIKIPWKIREFDEEVLSELRDLRRGKPANPRTVRHIIPALRPGKRDGEA